MTFTARDNLRGRPRLTVVRGTHVPVAQDPSADWRRLAQAIIACTHELGEYLVEQRWGRVQEVMDERRELLTFLQRMELDAEGRRCLLSLEQAIAESESAINSICRCADRLAPEQT
ncbi:MAG TPA: hypothetical protein VJP84_08405 [Steroidobacteraceae bacterium]|jgi:hypothetical protein|nr:hypothetical protein [Steroidobacteraceae bacterium]